MNHLISRLIELQKPVLLELPNVANLRLLCKWGLDGSTCHSDWKIPPRRRPQRPLPEPEEEEDEDDEFNVEEERERPVAYDQLLMVCFVPLILYDERDRVIWKNPRPGSSVFCRPLSLQFIKETRETIAAAHRVTQQQIDQLEAIQVDLTPDRAVNVRSEFLLTMIDGKTFSTLHDIASPQVNTFLL